MSSTGNYEGLTLLVANRGEIAVRIIHTAKKLGLRTIAIYSASDTLSLHVALADKAVPLAQEGDGTEAQSYLAAKTIISICLSNAVTLLHPGYGFLSENADFASLVADAGITWLGPRPDIIRMMGLKHEARIVAAQAGVAVVPGSELLSTLSEVSDAANKIGYPVMLKATAGGGGLGMVICEDEETLRAKFLPTQTTSKSLFGTDGLFIEKYFSAVHHIEIQIFGNGLGDVVHMGERECSVQRRHQKIIEESPSTFFERHRALRQAMCDAAIKICKYIKYNSAGTVEFLVDDSTGTFYFLEMNTRIQVEHPVTEAIHPGLDLVKLMIEQGISERQHGIGLGAIGPSMQQTRYDELKTPEHAHAIEGRIYAENPYRDFLPSPGLLQMVDLPDSNDFDWLRVESWITTGLSVTPFFDGLLCKVIVTGRSRQEAIDHFVKALNVCEVFGPPNNIDFLKAIAGSDAFLGGHYMTSFLNDFVFLPRVLTVLSAGIECTVQDLPGRTVGFGVPRGGPMDSLAFSVGNTLVGNLATTEGLEILVLPTIGCVLEFSVATVIAITGKEVSARVNDVFVNMWSRITVPAGGRLQLGIEPERRSPHFGFRVYISIRGGLTSVPFYLGSKSTSMGLGGYQGRPLFSGDQLSLGLWCGPLEIDKSGRSSIPDSLIPKYSSEWIVHVLPGPQDDDEFLTVAGRVAFYSTKWHVSLNSNRLGIRLESTTKMLWARSNGGEGGSHPSNILDNGYAMGTINVNGDTPVILTNDAPDMGGYVSVCTVVSADLWKLGQVQPGDTIHFRRISWACSRELQEALTNWHLAVCSSLKDFEDPPGPHAPSATNIVDSLESPQTSSILYRIDREDELVTFRQAGDSSILAEFGAMKLDLDVRARIHLFEMQIVSDGLLGLHDVCPCIRSIMFHYDAAQVSQENFLSSLVTAWESVPTSTANIKLIGRRISFPIVLDDPWNKEALERYMKTVRQKAVYLPSNIDYLAKNNGLMHGSDALKRLVQSDWLVVGVGFYLGCPFLIPIDPRCRLNGQKMNPSRTFTPRGAVGIAGPVAAIYPIESPGGYQLYGRTLPTWQTWSKGRDFNLPWLLQSFDQIHFDVIDVGEYREIERTFDSGVYEFKIEPAIFSMEEYKKMLHVITGELQEFQEGQRKASLIQAERHVTSLRFLLNCAIIWQRCDRERELFSDWELERQSTISPAQIDHDALSTQSATITAPLHASVLKIKSYPGYVIPSSSDVLLILGAMKMEVPVRAGEINVGKTIKRLGEGIKEEAPVRLGDVLFVLA